MNADKRRALKLLLDQRQRAAALAAGDKKFANASDPHRAEREDVQPALWGKCRGVLKLGGRWAGLVRCTHRAGPDGYCRKHGPNASAAYLARAGGRGS